MNQTNIQLPQGFGTTATDAVLLDFGSDVKIHQMDFSAGNKQAASGLVGVRVYLAPVDTAAGRSSFLTLSITDLIDTATPSDPAVVPFFDFLIQDVYDGPAIVTRKFPGGLWLQAGSLFALGCPTYMGSVFANTGPSYLTIHFEICE